MTLIIKLYSDDCEICKQMERHDSIVFAEFSGITYRKVELNDLLDNERDATKEVIYKHLEQYCLTPTYEVDLPTYIFMTSRGQYLGNQVGAATVSELRSRVKTFLTADSGDP